MTAWRGLPFIIVFTLLIIGASAPGATAQDKPPPEIVWREWNDKLFRDAKQTKRYILLDLHARWCHWCHFMERRTYASAPVREIVDAGYLAVKVDQDANPDLASRYGDWGWPATIIFDPDGKEVAKLQGFQRPSLMANILYTVLAHPERVPQLKQDAEVKPSASLYLTDEQRGQLVGLLEETYDKEHAGWGRRLKFLQPEVIEYALKRSREGDATMTKRLRRTLDAAMSLIDPVWGGTYQYSHARDWSAPHYEKIMAFQAQGISLYAKAYAQFGDEKYLKAALEIARFLMTRMRSPKGAFYTSQDADVDEEVLGKAFYTLGQAERAALGKQPSIDKNRYARENGWAASGLLDLYAVTGESTYRDAARDALEWVMGNRVLPGGGFRHGSDDKGGPYLSDTLAMGEAMLALYMASGETVWLTRSAEAADFLGAKFKFPVAGFMTTHKPRVAAGAFRQPHLNIEENIHLSRFANMLSRTHGAKRFRDLAGHAMQYLTSDSVVSRRRFMLGTVLADTELAIEPAHITIIGRTGDAVADALHAAALKLPLGYKRVDRWDPAAGPLLNPDVKYPEMDRAAAFACANQLCSLPVFEASELVDTVEKMMTRRKSDR
ncbi:MAG: DUF255 domain-containing protein [Pseudomonadota bacterium]